MSTATTHTGLRERNKLDKLQRIKSAARELFISKGFDEATTREIAARANVGMGTIFLYANNKRDLLFLIANDPLKAIVEQTVKDMQVGSPVLTNLMRAFRPHYEYFGAQPSLSRYTLREMMFYDTGEQARQFQATRERLIEIINDIIKAGQDRGTIGASENAQFIGWVVFCIYQVELRHWLAAEAPDVKEGTKRLEKALKLLFSGAAARSGRNGNGANRDSK